MSNASVPVCPFCASVGGVGWLLRQFDRVPYAMLALPLRLAVATVFWNSGMTKLADWNATLALFADEYQVPLLPPELAANLALTIELTTPVFLVLGLLTRPTAMLLLLLCRGAGAFSLDAVIERLWSRSQGNRTNLNVNLEANSCCPCSCR